jgi:hypothetical protein
VGEPSVLDNTPWWLPGVSTGGAAGILVARCSAYEQAPGAGPRHLEGGFYGLESLGPHVWVCNARADGRFTMRCRCRHKGNVQQLCNGHAAMIRQRGSGVCPPCVHPPAELEIQEAMASVRARVSPYSEPRVLAAAETRLWDLQDKLNELVRLGVVHRCPLRLEEVS